MGSQRVGHDWVTLTHSLSPEEIHGWQKTHNEPISHYINENWNQMRNSCTPIIMVKIFLNDNIQCWWGSIATWTLLPRMQNRVMVLENRIWLIVSKKLHKYLQCYPAILLLLINIYPREMKTHIRTKTCTQVHSSTIHNCQKLKTTQNVPQQMKR